jgi:hypothetical protein
MLLSSFQSHSEIEWTDEMAFADLSSVQSYIEVDDIISPDNAADVPNPSDDNICKLASGKLAIHFSSHLNKNLADIEKWIHDWRNSCVDLPGEGKSDWFDGPLEESEKVISGSMNTVSLNNCLVNIHGLHHSDNEFVRSVVNGAMGEMVSIHHNYGSNVENAEGQHLQSIYPPFIYRQNNYEVCGLNAQSSSKSVGRLYYCPNIVQTIVNDVNKMRLFNEWSRYWDLNKPYLIQQSSTLDVLLLEKFKLLPTFHVITMTHPFRWGINDMDKLSLLFVWLDVWTHTLEILALEEIQSFAVLNYEILPSSLNRNTSQELDTIIENSCFPDAQWEQLHIFQQTNVADNVQQTDTELWNSCENNTECHSLMDDLTPIISQFGYSWNKDNPFSPSYVENSTSNLLFSSKNVPKPQLLQTMKALVSKYIL